MLAGSLGGQLALDPDAEAEQILNVLRTAVRLAKGPSDRAGLRCPYRPALRSGRCDDGLPRLRGRGRLPRPEDDLAAPAFERVGPLRFMSLAPRLAFDAWAAPLRESLGEFDGEMLRFDPEGQPRL